MTNLEKYDGAFRSALGQLTKPLLDLNREGTPEWDSVGHMQLITSLEDAFGLVFDPEDIIEFDSYAQGKSILKKYGYVV